jgi:hypothetical protein
VYVECQNIKPIAPALLHTIYTFEISPGKEIKKKIDYVLNSVLRAASYNDNIYSITPHIERDYDKVSCMYEN